MAATSTTTTTTTTTSTRNVTKLVVTPQANTQTVGTFVTNVSVQPYIASRIVSFIAYNMRPNCRMHIFFDSVLVDEHCAPGGLGLTFQFDDTSDFNGVPKNGNWGDPIYSDANGVVNGQFNIPEGTFRTGDRVLQITDVDSLAYGNDAYTTIASATFTASNLSVTKESVTLTTVNPELNYVPVEQTVVTTNTQVTIKQIPDIIKISAQAHEPIAQALTINTPNAEAGVFATSLDLFFKKKSLLPNHGVTVYLCEMENGYPNNKAILPFSRVHLNRSDINDDGTATTFTFEAPVFLQNGREYAFIVKPDSNDPDYYVYSAKMGDTDLDTGLQVFSQPVIGTAYYGATDSTWVALPTEYIKFELRRASFANNSAEAIFENKPFDFLTVSNLGYTSGQSIKMGDYVFESVNSYSNSIGGTVNTSIFGVVNYYDSVKNLLYVDRSVSANSFTPDTYIQIHRFANSSLASSPNNVTLIAWANTGEIHDITVDSLVPKFASIAPAGTTLKVSYKGTKSDYSQDTNYISVPIGTESNFYDASRIVASKTNEDANLSGNQSLHYKVTMTTDTDYLSPLIDTVKYQQLALQNSIDPISQNYDEFFSSGNAKAKYISKIITLATGQDAEDLQVILSAYRPANSDIQVWVRFLNGDDNSPISQKTWTPLINKSQGLYSNPSDPNDFREYVYSVGAYYKLLQTTGTITSTNTSTTITGNNTLFTTELSPGWYINMRANTSFSEVTRKIVSIANNTSLILDTPFNGNYTNTAYYLVPPPTTPWLSTDSKTQVNGTVSSYTTNNTIVGSGTYFTTQVAPADIISINGDKQQVVSVVNNTVLTVGTPWSSNNTGANAFIVTPAGLTYLNDSNGLYSGFKKFQIKVVLMADNSSKVPIIQNLRALALQL